MLRKKTNELDPADWFAFAEDRMRCADVLWEHEGLTAGGIELLQEGVERYLKGFLIANSWDLVKTHDLERLLAEACKFNVDFSRFAPLALQLTEEFFAQHYPGHDTQHVGENYEMLRCQTGGLIELIKSALPTFFADK